ncbi:hypothetical protein [Lonsdalea quercina]|uniref:hypothetical protein n=1 Tax=Lonsdalea quercina TaxID=71657 RepID=UPI003976FF6E
MSERTSFYFFLPDGPYGRPFDNQYSVKSVDLTDKGIEIRFSEDLLLCFTGNPKVIDEGCNLLIAKYQLCSFEDHNQLLRSFDYGEVVLSGF